LNESAELGALKGVLKPEFVSRAFIIGLYHTASDSRGQVALPVSYNVLVKALQYLQVLILVAILAYLGWFHLSNPFPVSFPVPILGALPVSASMALLGGLLAGLVYALLLFAPHLIRRSNLIRRQNRKIRDLEAQVTKLQPIASAPVIPDRTASNQQDQTLEQMREKGML
jgi:lipopolysaccharide assembly protein A